ncbi:precorrin-2 C(20)-methyltransferase [Calidifontibacillus erzurumensis]|uniref:precorrin-2 C(20)-methyltransferase n=1 Tax=Calidifontibacillus erzurumensis TaxID=2741433 RepID=UPI0035B52553
MVGTLYGVGVGPGDPELITVQAYRVLKESPVIAYPKSRKGKKSYAYKIIDAYVSPNEKEMLGLIFPMTKDQVVLEKEWTNTVEAVYSKLAEGKDVAFVTEGDPLLYSTFIHLMKLMKSKYAQVPIKTVPGISSINGAAARLGLPLADGDEKIAIVPATEDTEAMKKVLLENDCVIFLKVSKVMNKMMALLEELQLLNNANVITKATSDEEIIWNLYELPETELEYLTLMVVRK